MISRPPLGYSTFCPFTGKGSSSSESSMKPARSRGDTRGSDLRAHRFRGLSDALRAGDNPCDSAADRGPLGASGNESHPSTDKRHRERPQLHPHGTGVERRARPLPQRRFRGRWCQRRPLPPGVPPHPHVVRDASSRVGAQDGCSDHPPAHGQQLLRRPLKRLTVVRPSRRHAQRPPD